MNQNKNNGLNNIDWCPNEKFALVDTENENQIFFGADTEESCRHTLELMTPKHPRFKNLILVKRPNEIIAF